MDIRGSIRRVIVALFVALAATLGATGVAVADQEIELTPQGGRADAGSFGTSIDISPDQSLIVVSGLDGAAQVWTRDGRLLRRIRYEDGELLRASFASDGRTIVALVRYLGERGDRVVFLDTLTGEPAFVGAQYDQFYEAAADAYPGELSSSPDRSFFVTSTWDGLQIWDPATGLPGTTLDGAPEGAVDDLTVSPDGQFVAALRDGNPGPTNIEIWTLATGTMSASATGLPQGADYSIDFAPDGRTVIVAKEDGGTIQAIDMETGGLLWTHPLEIGSQPLTTVPERGLILTPVSQHNASTDTWCAEAVLPCNEADMGNVIIRDIADGRRVGMLKGLSGQIEGLAVAEDGSFAAGFSASDGLLIWDLDTLALTETLGIVSSPTQAGFVTGDGDSAALLDDRGIVRFLDIDTGAITLAVSTSADAATLRPVSASGQQFATEVPEGIGVFDSDGPGRIVSLREVDTNTAESTGYLLAIDAAAARAAVRLTDNRVRVVSLADGSEITTLRTAASPKGAAFSPDGEQLAVVTYSLLESFDVDSGERLLSIDHPHEFQMDVPLIRSWVEFLGSDTLISNSVFGPPIVWDLATGRGLRSYANSRLLRAPPDVSIDLGLLLSELEFENAPALYDLFSGERLRTFTGHADTLTFMSLASEGRLAVSSSRDGTTRLWDAATGEQLLLVMTGEAPEDWLAVTPAGFFNYGGDGMSLIAVVDGLTAYGVEQFYDALYRPDLVQALLAGDPALEYADAAAELNLRSILESGTLPEIRVVDTEQVGSELRIVAEVTARNNGGIGDIAVSVRGEDDERAIQRAYQPAGRGEALAAAELPCEPNLTTSNCLRVDRLVPLESGRNFISIVAYNGANLLATDPVVLEVDAGEVTVPRGDLYVLALGVNDYAAGGVRGLSSAVADAEAIATTLSEMRDPDLYDAVHVEVLRNAQVTRANLDAVFTELGEAIRPEDKFVFFVAGHGTTRAGRYYFFPQDFTYDNGGSIAADAIGQDQWRLWFDRIKARASLFLYDTCEAGTVARNDDLAKGGALRRMIPAMGRNVITASSSEQAASESGEHGLFTQVLLEAFAKADYDGNDWVDITDLQLYVDDRVPVLSRERYGTAQDPTISIQANFPVGRMAAPTLDDAPAAAIPREPTHFVALEDGVDVVDDAGGIVAHLEFFAGVRVLAQEANGMLRIARDGVELGLVTNDALRQPN